MTFDAPVHSKVTPALALAVIASSNAPLILLDGDFTMIAASRSFCAVFQIDPARTAGRQVFSLGDGEWDVPQFRSLLYATLAGDASIDAYEMDLKIGSREDRRLVLNAQKLDYGDDEQVRILLAIVDVTEARKGEKLKDELLREKALLLLEVQHRIANSLQIIASVLMVSARRVQSEETRLHLTDAHSRVMSIAALQRHLATTGQATVKLDRYFDALCQSLAASMIYDRRQLKLSAHVDDSIVDADTSVSLGLIVTELVINALKHAFPGDRIGAITVDYRADGPDWTLSVSDNGVGMPAKGKGIEPGLGTSIIEALASKLRATVVTTDAEPGTMVAIVHTENAAEI